MNLKHRLQQSFLALLLGILSGCAADPPRDALEKDLAKAGIHEPIQFIVDGMPTDAADGASVQTLTLTDAVKQALANDAEVQASLAKVRIGLAEADQARLLPNPVVSVGVRFPEGGGKPIIDASLSADLIALLFRSRQIDVADNRLRAASSEALTTILDTIAEVQDRYVTVQSLDAQTLVLAERKRLIERLLELARARVEAGESAQLDAITLNSERVSLEVEILQTASERRQERLALARLIGQPSGRADWELTPWSAPTWATEAESSWVAAAAKHRPEIQARLWELAALGDEAAIAKAAAFEGSEVGVDAERDDTWSVGPSVSVPLPLFDWGQGRRAKVASERSEARHRLTQTRRQVIEEVRRAFEALAASQGALEKVRKELIPLEDQRREQAEAAYKNGFADITAVLLAEQDAQAARGKLIELQQKASSARFRLERAAGGPGAIAAVPASQPTTQTSN